MNQILHQTGELSAEYIHRRTNEKINRLNAPKYKIIPVNYTNRSKSKNNKKQLELFIKAVDYIIVKFGLENELLNLLN